MRTALPCVLLLFGCGEAAVDNDFGELSEPEPVEEPVEVAAEEPEVRPQAAKGNVFQRNDRGLVDMREAMSENPKLYKTTNKSVAGDYLTAVKDAGFAGASSAQASALRHDLDIWKAANDRWPTYEEYRDQWKNTGQGLAGLKPYQMWAYDDETGEVAILEDPDEKKAVLGR